MQPACVRSVNPALYVYFVQDGFFDGELMDGRRGLVPSNFIQKVPGIFKDRVFVDHCNAPFIGNKQLTTVSSCWASDE